MEVLSTLSAVFPIYRQEGTEQPSVPYLMISLIFSIVVGVFDLILDILEYKESLHTEPPEDVMTIIKEIDDEKKEGESEKMETRVRDSFYKSQLYKKDRTLFKIVKSVFMNVVSCVLLLTGFLPFLYDIAKSISGKIGYESYDLVNFMFFVVLNSLFETIVDFPWSVYSTFVIEEKYGFNKQTFRLFIVDMIKNFFISFILDSCLYGIVSFILRKVTQRAFLYLWIVLMVFIIVFNMIYPIVIIPLFNKLSSMDPSPLRDRIYDLAKQVGFRIGRIQVIDSSKRTGHSNAAAYGFFGVNGILIYDTLLTQLSENEIVATLGHELGHWKHAHTYKNLVVNALYMFCMLQSFSLFVFSRDVYASFGFAEMPILIGFVLFLSNIWSCLSEVLSTVMNVLSRKFEYQADKFAADLGYGHDLKLALVKLNVENASSLKSHWLVGMIRHSHPSLLERCQEISKIEKKSQFVVC